MRLTIVGGGGFRVPLVYGALLTDHASTRIDEVRLYDVDAGRLTAIAHVLAQMAEGIEDPPRVQVVHDLDAALDGADFVFSALRVGGLQGRTRDEHVALDLGSIGQETTGPGGIAYGLRTVPVAVELAERIGQRAPYAWTINFTNPAGMVTEAMQRVLGDRVVGICDSPIALARRAAHALGLDPASTYADYVGLNHLGWLRRLVHGGVDVLPRLLADDQALGALEEVRLFGAEWVRTLGAIPNEYLYYFYFNREAVASVRAEPATRGDFLLEQQSGFYAAVAEDPSTAWALWRRVRRGGGEGYMAAGRGRADPRGEGEPAGGGGAGGAREDMAAGMS